MYASILGWILVGLGILFLLVGLVMGVLVILSEILREITETLSNFFSLNLSEFAKTITESITKLLIEMMKTPGGVYFVVGLILIGGGTALLVYTPF